VFRRACYYFLYLLVVWTIFRYFSHLPEVIEEVWFKPIIWLVPLFWLNVSAKKRIKFFDGGVLRMVIWGGGVGLLYLLMFVLMGKSVSHGFNLNGVGVALITAVVENLVFVGFLLPIFREKFTDLRALIFTAVLFGVIHLPIAWFFYRLDLSMMFYLFWMMSLIGLVNGWLRLKTNNVGTAVLTSWIWSILALI
jgi:membrane protease YdiL (CAAX protease family)